MQLSMLNHTTGSTLRWTSFYNIGQRAKLANDHVKSIVIFQFYIRSQQIDFHHCFLFFIFISYFRLQLFIYSFVYINIHTQVCNIYATIICIVIFFRPSQNIFLFKFNTTRIFNIYAKFLCFIKYSIILFLLSL